MQPSGSYELPIRVYIPSTVVWRALICPLIVYGEGILLIEECEITAGMHALV